MASRSFIGIEVEDGWINLAERKISSPAVESSKYGDADVAEQEAKYGKPKSNGLSSEQSSMQDLTPENVNYVYVHNECLTETKASPIALLESVQTTSLSPMSIVDSAVRSMATNSSAAVVTPVPGALSLKSVSVPTVLISNLSSLSHNIASDSKVSTSALSPAPKSLMTLGTQFSSLSSFCPAEVKDAVPPTFISPKPKLESKVLETKWSPPSACWSDVVRIMEAKQQQIWECPSCTLHNPIWRSICGACQRAFNQASYSPKQATRRIRPRVELSDATVEETPKEWSLSCRARKFGEHGIRSGNTVWTPNSQKPQKPTSLMSKVVRVPNGMAPDDEKAWKAPTSFEVETGLVFPNNNRRTTASFSMDKKKRWDWVSDMLTEEADIAVTTSLGRKDRWTARGIENNEVKSFVMLQPVTYAKKEGKEDKEIGAYLDHLAKSAKKLPRTQLTTSRQQRHLRCIAVPEGVHYPRLNFTLKSRSVSSDSNLRSAKVELDHQNCFWAPSKLDDGGDYLDVDMGKLMFVVALGVKGRAPARDLNDEIKSDSKSEWVTRFKAFWKSGERDVWKPLGDFAANDDSETEVVNFVLSPHTEQPGLELRYLRIQPTAFHHRKSMRVGVYGQEIESLSETEETEKMDKQFSLDEVTSRKVSTPAVIFSIESTVTNEKAGKFNFKLDTLQRGGSFRAVEKRRAKRGDRSKIRRFGCDAAVDTAGENLECSVFSSSTFPRSNLCC